MKKGHVSSLIFFLSFFFVPVFSLCEIPSSPVAYVENDSFSFGSVVEGTKVSHEFVIKNTGGSDLQILKVLPSCGCTVSKAEPELVPPGSKSTLKVLFDSSGFSGQEIKKIKVVTNDPENPTLTFTIRGIVENEIVLTPVRVSFDSVVKGSSVQREVSIKIKDGSSHTISSVVSYNPSFILTPVRDSPKEYSGIVTLAPDAPLGEIRDRIGVSLIGTKKGSSVTIPVYARVKGEVEIAPSVVSFGLITPQSALERVIKVESALGKDLIVSKVATDNSMIKATLRELEPKRRYVVRLALDLEKIKGEVGIRGVVMIETNLGTYSVSVFGAFPPRR